MSLMFNAVACRAAGLAAVLLSGPALAQEGGKVQVGAMVKNSSGVLLAMEMGDDACILSLRDDKGVSFQEMAESTICQKPTATQGMRVALGYTLAKVPASECQGNANCTKSRVIAVVNAIRDIDSGSAHAKGQPASTPASAGQQSFCTAMEDVVFSCRPGAKLVSVCASKKATRLQGYMQYRFGSPQTGEIEMMVPARSDLPAKSVTAESQSFAAGGGSWIRFRNGAISYVVYDGIGKWGPRGETVEKRGVVVERSGKTIANLRCTSAPINNMGPELFDKLGLSTQKDEDFDFSQ